MPLKLRTVPPTATVRKYAHTSKIAVLRMDGFRESTESWKALLLSLRDRGVKLAICDGALGFWAALSAVYPQTHEQRCWVHKTVNVLDKLPKRLQGPAKSALHDIWQADGRAAADKAFDRFIAVYEDKYPRAVERLVKDRAVLLAFYGFPAAHWQHIRTTDEVDKRFLPTPVAHSSWDTPDSCRRSVAGRVSH